MTLETMQDFNLILLDQFLKGDGPKVEMMYTCNVSCAFIWTWANVRATLYLTSSSSLVLAS